MPLSLKKEGNMSNILLAAVKQASGIECANCLTCAHKGQDSDGGEAEYAISWDTCEKHPHYTNLKSFPFSGEQECWKPEFWHSKFATQIKTGEHEELMGLVDKFVEAVKTAKERSMSKSKTPEEKLEDLKEAVRELGEAIEEGDPQRIADLWVHCVKRKVSKQAP